MFGTCVHIVVVAGGDPESRSAGRVAIPRKRNLPVNGRREGDLGGQWFGRCRGDAS